MMAVHWRRTAPSLLLFLIYCNETLSDCMNVGSTYKVVQSHPVIFLTEPKSQALALGENLTLICHANVTPLNGVSEYVYVMPTMQWRFNGSTLTEGGHRNITTDRNTGLSTLLVQNVSHDEAGTYECLVNDANGHFITVSRKAVIQVTKNVYQLFVEAGQPVQLECGPLVSAETVVTWKQNGQDLQASDESAILADNGHTLLLVSVKHEDGGLWECFGTESEDEGVPGTRYDITVAQGNYSGPPYVLFNTSGLNPQEGMPFTLQCLTAPNLDASVVWLSGEQASGLSGEQASGLPEFFVPESHKIEFEAFTSDDAGSFTCAVLDEDFLIIVQATIDLQLTAPPQLISKPVTEKYIEENSPSLELTCKASGHPAPSVLWLKDGEVLSMDLYNYSTGILSVTSADVPCGKLHGVYQCSANNSAGEEATVTRVLIKGVSNPTTDLVCSFTVNMVKVGLPKPQLEVSWNPPIPNGGTERKYLVTILDPSGITFNQEVDVTHHVQSSLEKEGEYIVYVQVAGSDSGVFVFCSANSFDRFEQEPADFDTTCQSGSVHIMWNAPTVNPSVYPANNMHVTASCLHGNDSQFYDEAYATVEKFDETVLTGLPSGTVCLITGSFTLPSSNGVDEEKYNIPTSNCFLDGLQVSDEAVPGDPRLNITCEASTVWLSWDVPDTGCLGSDYTYVNITGVCLNETWTEEYNMMVDIVDVAGDVVVYPSISPGSICSFTGSYLGENNTVELIAAVQCIMDEFSPAAYKVTDKNFTRSVKNCSADSPKEPTGTEVMATTEELDTTDKTATMEQLITTNRQLAISDDVSVLIGILIFTSIVIPCSLAGILVGVAVLYLRKRRSKRSLLEMEVSAYKSTVKWSSHFDDGDTTSIKTNLDAMVHNEPFQEIPPSLVIPVYDFTVVDQFGFPVRQSQEEAMEGLSSRSTELQSEDGVSLDPTERWSSPIEKRPIDDSGCFLVTDKDGLAKEVSKQEIPVDKTGSSGFWSESAAPQRNMINYHDSIKQDLAEVESDGKNPPMLTSGKTYTEGSCLSSVVNTDSHTFAKVKDDLEAVQQQKGVGRIANRTSVSCIVVETDSRTCIRVTMDQNHVPTADTRIPIVPKSTGAETVEDRSDSRSLSYSSMETLSQSSGSNEYINHHRHHSDSTDVHVSNLLYTDGKGYLRFVTKSTGMPVPVSVQ